MSYPGIKQVAKFLEEAQRLSYELVQMGSEDGAEKTPEGQQDIRLGHLLNHGEGMTLLKKQFTEEVSRIKLPLGP